MTVTMAGAMKKRTAPQVSIYQICISSCIFAFHQFIHCHPAILANLTISNGEFLGVDPRLLQPPVNSSRTRRRGDDCQQEQPHLHRALAALLEDAHRRHHQGR